MATFYSAVEKTLQFEGGYTNDPNDPGGPTKYGITLATLQSVTQGEVTAEDVENLDIEKAKEIYKAVYWVGDNIQSQAIAEKHFDIGVNMGVVSANRMLQTACNLSITDAGNKLAVDGHVGPHTLQVINSIQETVLMSSLCNLQESKYWLLVETEIGVKADNWGWPADLKESALLACRTRCVDGARSVIRVLKHEKLKLGKLSFIPGWTTRARNRFGI